MLGEGSGGVAGTSVARNARVDYLRPVVDAAGKRLRLFEALLAQPHGDGERTRSVVAEHDDWCIGVELGVARLVISPIGIRVAPGIAAVSNSHGSRTSSRSGGCSVLRSAWYWSTEISGFSMPLG
jgi:hypothetical protein